MGKQHDTFLGEQSEMPVPEKKPEVKQPDDPKEPQVPEEDPEQVPKELPVKQNGDELEKTK
jgi:hypothetical protein